MVLSHSVKFVCVEGGNYSDFPLGGTLSFSKHLINAYGKEVGLVGLVDAGEETGKWFYKSINGTSYAYYGIAKTSLLKKTKLPRRLLTTFFLLKHVKNIYNTSNKVVFTRSPTFVFVLRLMPWKKFCFYFAGITNSILISRYKLLRVFSKMYEKRLFKDLAQSTDKIFAAASKDAIKDACERNNNIINARDIEFFPTRYDGNIFFKKETNNYPLNLCFDNKIILSSGRLSGVKGWNLMVDAFRCLYNKDNSYRYLMVGEGEDRAIIQDYARDLIDAGCLHLLGYKNHTELNDLLNITDVYVMASLTEGWPTSMVETLSVGKKVVSTNVSGAEDMIKNGRNGFIVKNRDFQIFAKKIEDAILLDSHICEEINAEITESMQLKGLKKDLDDKWLNQ